MAPQETLLAIPKTPNLDGNDTGLLLEKTFKKRLQSQRNELSERATRDYTEVIPGREIPDDLLRQIVQLYREDFGSEQLGAWGEYLKCPMEGCTCKLSIEQAYQLAPGSYTPLEQLESKGVPIHHCDEHQIPLEFFWPEEKVFHSFHEKYRNSQSSLCSLYYVNNTLQGFTIAYQSTLKEAWDKEFKDLYDTNSSQHYDLYKEALSHILGEAMDDNSNVFVWNLVEVRLPYRSPEALFKLGTETIKRIPEQYFKFPMPAELHMDNPYTCTALAWGGEVLHKPRPDIALGIAARYVESYIRSFQESFTKNKESFIALRNRFRNFQKNGWKIDPRYNDADWLLLKQALSKTSSYA